MTYFELKRGPRWLLVLALLLQGPWREAAEAQTVIGLDSAEARSLRRHPRLRQSDREVEEQRALKRGSFAPANPDLLFSAPSGERWAPGVVQTIDFPNVYRRQRQVAEAGISLAERNREVSRATVLRDTRLAYLSLQFAEAQIRQLTYQDSLYQALRVATERLFAAGEITSLQRISTEAEARQVAVQLLQATADLRAAQRRLGLLLGQPTAAFTASTDLRRSGPELVQTGGALLSGLPTEDSAALVRSPTLAAATQNVALSQSGISLVRARRTPRSRWGTRTRASRIRPPVTASSLACRCPCGSGPTARSCRRPRPAARRPATSCKPSAWS
ncbi:hypothetical protein BEN48_12435 [Hymenobacter glacialis]|uniref:Transporter n=1 Tax=Hymenobacter glacialis TaxID=1908236 RepID=A0A1G1T6S8_9BACT|nr:hypothetical protein BEN48_12435 [Hymenobacter glacialis]